MPVQPSETQSFYKKIFKISDPATQGTTFFFYYKDKLIYAVEGNKLCLV